MEHSREVEEIEIFTLSGTRVALESPQPVAPPASPINPSSSTESSFGKYFSILKLRIKSITDFSLQSI